MCLVQAWKKGFEAIAKALTLLHHSRGGLERKMPKSRRSMCIQHNLTAEDAKALYLASVEDPKNCGLLLGRPGNRTITKKDNNANNRLTINQVPSPISITIAKTKGKTMVKSASNVPQNVFKSLKNDFEEDYSYTDMPAGQQRKDQVQ